MQGLTLTVFCTALTVCTKPAPHPAPTCIRHAESSISPESETSLQSIASPSLTTTPLLPSPDYFPVLRTHNIHNTHWFLHTNASFIVTDVMLNKKRKIAERTLLIHLDQRALRINGTTVPLRSIRIESTDGTLYINNSAYKAFFSLNSSPDTPDSSISIVSTQTPTYALLIPQLTPHADSTQKNDHIAQATSHPTTDMSIISDTRPIDPALEPTGNNKTIHNRISQKNLRKKKAQQTALALLNNKDTEIPSPNQSINTQHPLGSTSDVIPSLASCKIRVLLDQLKDETAWHLSSDAGFILWNSNDKQQTINSTCAELHISKKNNQLSINNQLYCDELLHIAPIAGIISFNGNPYDGAFLITQKQNQISLINNVELEEYVFGVLRTESWPGWPLEVHKVCAIACRSYAIATAMRAHKSNRIYHIKNTNEHQTYAGSHTNKVLQQAVDETRGVFISYNNQPIFAMYDICCGGIIPAHMENMNFQQTPYLARQYPCSYCKICKPYSWETTCSLADFEKLVNKSVQTVKNVKSITVTKKDKAGLVREVTLKNKGAPLSLSGQKMYSLMKEIKSLCFQTQNKGKQVVIKGRGFGHHLGLCQWGAREMVRNGWSHKRILKFYYPGTDFMRIV